MFRVRGLYGHLRRNALYSGLMLAAFVVLSGALWYVWCQVYANLVHFPFSAPAGSERAAFDAAIAHGNDTALRHWYVPVIFSLAWLTIAYVFHARMINAATGAQFAERGKYPQLYAMTERLAIAAGLSMPRIEVIPTGALNAYAAGLRASDAVVAVTQGLIDTLDSDELEAVIAHELTHIRNGDLRLMLVSSAVAGCLALPALMWSALCGDESKPETGRIEWGEPGSSGLYYTYDPDSETNQRQREMPAAPLLASFMVAVLVAVAFFALIRLLARLVDSSLSRTREYLADAGAVELTRNPDALIRALKRIAVNDKLAIPAQLRGMLISSDPEAWLATHPSTEDRVAAIVAYAGGHDLPVRTHARRTARISLEKLARTRTFFRTRGGSHSSAPPMG